MLKEKLKMMNGVLENGNYQLGQFQFAERSAAMKAPVGLLSDRTVLRQQMEEPCPDKFADIYPLSAKRPFPLLHGEAKRPLFIFSGIPVVSCRSVS